MVWATFFLSGRDWLLPAVGLLGVSLLVMLWAYRTVSVSPGLRVLCVCLKLLGLLALAACLLEPLWSGQRARPGANLFVILADNSQGLQIKDRAQTRSRGELLQGLLTGEKASWQSPLEENFQLRRYLFDSRLRSTMDFSELNFDGRSSAMGTALRGILDRYRGQPCAGMLLLTDGNATDLAGAQPDLAGLPPIYPVVIGGDNLIKDISIQNLTVSQTAFEDAPVSIQADVLTAGYAGDPIVAQLLELSSGAARTNLVATNGTKTKPATGTESSEKVVAEQTLPAGRDGETLPFRFQIRPERTGLLFYRMRVSARGELDQFDKLDPSTEATLANNDRVLVVDRGSGPYRILYVAGRPNWEYKFLNRAVVEDDQIQMVGLIRIARREPKFEFRGRAGESSNPLFRGFSNQSKEEIERYDQPVLVRLNTRDELELRGGFPRTAEELYAYHAVVLDDLEAEFFTPDQMTLLQKFVSERGGGFLMLGGQESFQQGKFNRTPIGDMLPVYLDQVAEAKPTDNLRLSLSREGWLQPWARLRSNETEEKDRLNAMPPFQILNRVRGIKPGASIIATVTDARSENYPAVVVQRFGNGRTAALTIGDLWRWQLRQENKDLAKAWRQLARWLVADVPARIELQAEQKAGEANQPVLLKVRARDLKFQPLDNASVTVTVHSLGKSGREFEAGGRPAASSRESRDRQTAAPASSIRLTAEPTLEEPGLYQATYIPRETGGYRAEAVVNNADGAQVGMAEAGWTSDPAAEEFRSLKPNRALLESIAKSTGGEVIRSDKLAEFARSLPNRKVPITESWSSPLWHRSWVFLFALACFVAEWGLRRWKGLA